MTPKKPGRPPKAKKPNASQTEESQDSQSDEHEAEIVGGATAGSADEPGTENPEQGRASGQPAERIGLGTEFSSILRTIDKGPSGSGRNLAGGLESNTPRATRSNSPDENRARTHQAYLDRFETLDARQLRQEAVTDRIFDILADIRREIGASARLPDRNQTLNNLDENHTNGQTGSLREGSNPSVANLRNTGAVPRRLV